MTPAEYKAMQDRIELLCRLILDTDPDQLTSFIGAGEHSDAIAPYFDPTAWIGAHGLLRMVIEHAKAIAAARRDIARSAEMAGVSR